MSLELICNNIRNWRRHRGFSQEEFAEKLGITRYKVVRIEQGKSVIGIDLMEKICKVLDVSYEVLKEEDH